MPDTHNPAAAATASLLPHGGDLAQVAGRPGAFTGGWLDLSTGINPWPYPAGQVPAAVWARLPGRALDERLRAAASAYYGAPGPDCVVPAPGSQALIQWLPRLRPPGAVAVLGPTYGEHAAAWAAAGHRVVELATLPEDLVEWDVVVVTNPNNPDGARQPPDRLLALAEALAAQGGWLVVDEAFADVAPELSLAAAASRPGLVLLRSFGKFFGLAGLRLGFALAAPAFAARLAAALGPWAVSGPAAWIAGDAFADATWITATRARLAAAAAKFDQLLAAAGLDILGSTSLYRLAATPEAGALAATLRRHGIHVRDFPARPHWLRFGLPPDEAGFARLRRALANHNATPPEASR